MPNNERFLLDGAESARLDYRLLETSDFDAWLPLFQAEDVARFLGMDVSLSPEEHCQLWFDKIFHRYENELGGMSVLLDKQSGKLIGQCGLLVQTVDEEERLEIGYSILPEFWNRGYASEAAQRFRNHGFEHKLAYSIISLVHVDNIASAQVAQKNGMQLEKTLESYKGMPAHVYSMTSHVWTAIKTQ